MSAQFDDGGPAYPMPDTCESGMSLRDWFAGQALQGELASSEEGEAVQLQTIENAGMMARRSYLYADAMLAARKERP